MQAPPILAEHLQYRLNKGQRIHAQQHHDKNKIDSVHAPEVECITKIKAHKHYGFGVTVSVITTSRNNFVVGMHRYQAILMTDLLLAR